MIFKKALCPQNRSNLSNVEVWCMHTHMIKDYKQYYPWVSELCLTSHQQLRVIWTNWRSWGLNMGPRRVVYPLLHGGYYMTPDFWYHGYENQERFHTTCHLMQTRRVGCIQFNIQLTLVNSTMHNSILSLISTRRPGPGIFPYILLQFHNV